MTDTREQARSAEDHLPFKPSWMDGLVAWIDRLPGASWPYYLLSISVLGLLTNVVFWIDGGLPLGSINGENTSFALLVFLWLAFYHYLTRVASRSLSRFRPLLADEAAIERWHHELTRLPRAQGWVALAIGLVWAIGGILGGDVYYGGLIAHTALPFVFDLIVTTFLVSTFLCVLLRSVRQLRIVGVLQRQAVNIDLLNLEPAHGFSLLTSRTATGLVLLLVLAYLYDPFKALTAVDLFWYGLTVALAGAIFSLPIMGLRGRLEEEKRRALDETSRHLRMARELLLSKVSNKDLRDMKEVDAGLESLVRDRELYRRVSTWPWDPAAIGGFASALLLPIVLWLITRLLERLL